ncbi:hypothetical protein SSS_09915 [Sarcoptes scabiei]|nr:hypothetical protein SSS_09915 [Sarcoptes scabiei]
MDSNRNHQIIFGFLVAMKSFVKCLNPTLDFNLDGEYFTFKNSSYRLVCYESPTGLRFVRILPKKMRVIEDDVYRFDSPIWQKIHQNFIRSNRFHSNKIPLNQGCNNDREEEVDDWLCEDLESLFDRKF